MHANLNNKKKMTTYSVGKVSPSTAEHITLDVQSAPLTIISRELRRPSKVFTLVAILTSPLHPGKSRSLNTLQEENAVREGSHHSMHRRHARVADKIPLSTQTRSRHCPTPYPSSSI